MWEIDGTAVMWASWGSSRYFFTVLLVLSMVKASMLSSVATLSCYKVDEVAMSSKGLSSFSSPQHFVSIFGTGIYCGGRGRAAAAAMVFSWGGGTTVVAMAVAREREREREREIKSLNKVQLHIEFGVWTIMRHKENNWKVFI